MVQATQAHKVEFEYEQPNQRLKRVYKKKGPSKAALIKVGLGVFIYGVLVVYLSIKVSTMGYQKVLLEKDLENLHAANRILEYQIAEQVSLEKVEKVATAELGMHKLDTSNAIAVAYEPEPNAVSQESTTDENTGNTNLGQRSLEKIFNNLMLLAEQR